MVVNYSTIKWNGILTGKDLVRLENMMKANETKKVSKEEFERAKNLYRTFEKNNLWPRALYARK